MKTAPGSLNKKEREKHFFKKKEENENCTRNPKQDAEKGKQIWYE
jgi:hypothetical protein